MFEGYLARSLAADAARLGYDTVPAGVFPLPPPAFRADLPPEAAVALEAMVALLRAGKFPALFHFRVDETYGTWGLPFAARGLQVLDANYAGDLSGEIFALGTDGAGNVWCLHRSGRVVVWNHEESNLEDHTQFDSLDEAVWALLRYEAVKDELLPYGELRPVLARMGDDTGGGFLREDLDEAYGVPA
ncbi:MAG: hypothetical protein R3F59_12600 [Myxococcota bacterium]